MCFKNLLSKAIPAFAGVALAFAGCDKVQTPPNENPTPEPEPETRFEMTVTDVTTSSCSVSIFKKDENEQRFYYAYVRKKSFDKLGETFQEKAKAYYLGEVSFYVNDFKYSLEEALETITSAENLEERAVSRLNGNTVYVVIAGYVDAAGNPVGDFEGCEFKTDAPEPSDNKIEVTVSNITARSAHVSVTATNATDQYKTQVFEATLFGDLTGAELADEMLEYYSSMPVYKKGNYETDVTKLKADTKYIAAAVGCTDNAPTTDIATVEFTTGPTGDIGKWNFTSNFTDGTYKGYKINVEIVPNDDTFDYCYELIPVEYSQEAFYAQFLENFKSMEKNNIKDVAAYTKLYGTYGTITKKDLNVKPGRSYRVAAVPVDPKANEFYGVIFGQAFEIEEPEYSDITISLDWDKYFDGAELPNLYLGDGAIFTPVVTTDAKKYFYGAFVDDGTTYSKEDIIYSLLTKGGRTQSSWIKALRVEFDKDAVVYAVAVDDAGHFGKVFSKKFKLTREGVSPADEYSSAKAAGTSDAE